MRARKERATQWDQHDLAAVSAHSKKLWAKRKVELGIGYRNSDFPGFREALDELHNLHGYSLSDLGAFFGVSCERIRQFFDKLNIPRRASKGSLWRKWDDEQNRFVAFERDDAKNEKRSMRHAAARRRATAKRERYLATYIAALCKLARQRGHSPSLVQLAEAVGHVSQTMAQHLGHRARDKRASSYRDAIGLIYDGAGLPQLELGEYAFRKCEHLPLPEGWRGCGKCAECHAEITTDNKRK